MAPLIMAHPSPRLYSMVRKTLEASQHTASPQVATVASVPTLVVQVPATPRPVLSVVQVLRHRGFRRHHPDILQPLLLWVCQVLDLQSRRHASRHPAQALRPPALHTPRPLLRSAITVFHPLLQTTHQHRHRTRRHHPTFRQRLQTTRLPPRSGVGLRARNTVQRALLTVRLRRSIVPPVHSSAAVRNKRHLPLQPLRGTVRPVPRLVHTLPHLPGSLQLRQQMHLILRVRQSGRPLHLGIRRRKSPGIVHNRFLY